MRRGRPWSFSQALKEDVECACTVLVDGERINSCLTLALQYEDRDIVTVEGLTRDDTLHPLQNAFVQYDGFQCGIWRFFGVRGRSSSRLTSRPGRHWR
jgi:hypothetical protein